MKSHRLMIALTIVNLVILVIILFKSGSAEAGTDPAVLRARAFELVDEHGEVRGQLFLGDDGGGNLRFRDSTGRVRVKLGASSRSAGLLLTDDEIEPAVHIITNASGTSLMLRDRNGREHVIRP